MPRQKISFAISKLGIAAVADLLHIAQMAKPQNTDRNSYRQCANCTKDNGIFFLYAANFLPMLAIYAATRRIEHPPKERPARTGLAPA